jgi:hypothetical protein
VKNKSYDTSSGSEIFDKDYHGKNILNKHEYDLFKESNDVVERVIRVKKVQMPNKGEKWKIFSDGKVVFVISGEKISKTEKEFLRTSDGFNFLIEQAKTGIKSLNQLRTNLKNNIKKKR